MNVSIAAKIDVSTDDIKKSCSPAEMASIFTDVANHFAESANTDEAAKRQIVFQMQGGLSRSALALLAEVLALAFHRSLKP